MPPRGRPVRPLVAFVVGLASALGAASCGVTGDPPTAPPASGIGAWTAGPAAPIALTEVAAATHGDRIVVAGGLDGQGGAVDSVLFFDPAAGTWTEGPALPEPIHHSGLVSTAGGLLLVGGSRSDGAASAAVQRLDEALGEWVPAPALPEPRAAGAVAPSLEGAVYAGGVGPAGVQVEVFRLDGLDGSWRVIGRLPVGREHVAATADEVGRVYVLGGRQGGLDSNQSVVDLVEGETVRTVGSVPTRRGGVAAFWWPSLGACLVGGESPGGTHAEVECIDAHGKVTGLPDLARPRHGLGAAVLHGAAWTLLGGERPGLFVSDAAERLELP